MKSPLSKTQSEILPLNGLRREVFITIAYETAQRLKGEIAYITPNQLVYYTPESAEGEREIVGVTMDEKEVTILGKGLNQRQQSKHKNKKNIEDFKKAFDDIKSSASEEELAEWYRTLIPKFSIGDSTPSFFTDESLKGLGYIFIPAGNYFITPLLININILVFIIMCITGVNIMEPSTADLLRWGGNFRSYDINGEWWRLLSSMFLHGGIIHLLMNMYALLYIGILLESQLGRIRFLAAYLLTGVCGGLLSISVHSFSVGVGASGAIFGMYGVFLAMLTTNLIEKKARNAMLQNILFFVVFNLAYGMRGNIDNAAHLGGLLSGMVIGYSYFPGLKKGMSRSPVLAILLLTVAVVTTAAFTFRSLPDDAGQYEWKMRQFSAYEQQALKFYKLSSDNTPRDTLLHYVQTGIDYWKKDGRIIDEFQKLDLPEGLKKRNAILQKYCEARLNTYELIYKEISGNHHDHDDKIGQYNEEVETLLKQLKE